MKRIGSTLGLALAVLMLLLAFAAETPGQPAKLKVHVSHSGSDVVGTQAAYAVREELRRSAGFALGEGNDYLFKITLVSLDTETKGLGQEGVSSAIAVVYTMANLLPLDKGNPQTWYDIYMTATTHIIGRDRTGAVGKTIVATLDRELADFRNASGK